MDRGWTYTKPSLLLYTTYYIIANATLRVCAAPYICFLFYGFPAFLCTLQYLYYPLFSGVDYAFLLVIPLFRFAVFALFFAFCFMEPSSEMFFSHLFLSSRPRTGEMKNGFFFKTGA